MKLIHLILIGIALWYVYGFLQNQKKLSNEIRLMRAQMGGSPQTTQTSTSTSKQNDIGLTETLTSLLRSLLNNKPI